MTEDKKQTPCLDEKGVEEKRIYIYRQCLERFKQSTKRKYDTESGPLIKEETMNGTEWEVKEEKTQQNFLWAMRPKATHQIKRSENRTEPDKIEIDQTNQTIQQILLTGKGRI